MLPKVSKEAEAERDNFSLLRRRLERKGANQQFNDLFSLLVFPRANLKIIHYKSKYSHLWPLKEHKKI